MPMCTRILLFLAFLTGLPAGASATGFTLDTSFGQGGVAVLPYVGYGQDVAATNLDVHPDGKLIVAGDYVTGVIFGGALTTAFITRLDGSGTPDPQFFGGSITRAPTPRVLFQRDGEVLAGSANSDGPLARYHRDGTLDRTFTGNAAAAIASVDPRFVFVDFALEPDGKVVVLGSVLWSSAPGFPGLTLLRLRTDGTLDTTFANGRDLFDAGTKRTLFAYFSSLARYPDGRLAVAVDNQRLLNRGIAIARVQANGEPDAAFGTGGVLDVGPQSSFTAETTPEIAVDATGRLVLAAIRVGQDAQEVSVRRLRADGALDTAFGNGGEVVLEHGTAKIEIGAIAVQPDHRILLAAGDRFGTMQFMRLAVDGTLDPAFGAAGILATPLDKIRDIALTPGGAIVVAGRLAGEAPRAALARFTGGVPAIEYHHAATDHYFLTADPLEARDLDEQVHPGWQRTGEVISVLGAGASATSGVNAVCRYYIPPGKGDSHFFSASAAECAAVGEHSHSDVNYAGYVLETPSAFFAGLPDPLTGACNAGMVPVYRLWNQRSDSNHRYTTRVDLRQQMVARGYLSEGYGPDGVGMCALP